MVFPNQSTRKVVTTVVLTRQRLISLIMSGVLALLMASLQPLHASATDSNTCSVPIIDELGAFGGQLDQVENAVAELETTGADVRIRTFETYAPYGSLDAKLRDMRVACDGNWSFDNGETMKGNLIVYAITTSPENAQMFFYGSDWEDTLGGTRSEQIQADIMAPYLGQGDFAGGVAAGLKQVSTDIFESREPSGGDTIVNEAPDLAGLWNVLRWLLLIAGAIVLAIILWRVGQYIIHRRNTFKENRARALGLKRRTAMLITTLSNSDNETSRTIALSQLRDAGGTYATVAEELENALRTHFDRAAMLHNNAENIYGDRKRLSYGEWQAAVEEYTTINDSAHKAEEVHNKIEHLSREVQAEVEKIPSALEHAGFSLSQHEQRTREMRVKGYRVQEISERLSAATSTLATLRSQPQAPSLLDDIEEFETSLVDIGGIIYALERNISDCLARQEDAKQWIEQTATLLPKGEEALVRMRINFNVDTWSGAEADLVEAKQVLTEARQLLSEGDDTRTEQSWYNARQTYEQACKRAEQARDLIESVMKHENTLIRLKESANVLIADTQRQIDRATDLVSGNYPVLYEPVDGILGQAVTDLASAASELAQQKPNYLELQKWAGDAEDLAVKAYENVNRQLETVQEAARKLESAAESIQKASKYIKTHTSDVNRSAQSDLETAKSRYDAANAASLPPEILVLANEAKSHADSAVKEAKRDVADAERQREEEEQARRRRERDDAYSSSTALGVGYGAGSSFGGGYGGGGGSSTGFGGGYGGGGGSSTGF